MIWVFKCRIGSSNTKLDLSITDVGFLISELGLQMQNWVFKYRFTGNVHPGLSITDLGLSISELGLQLYTKLSL